jgi:hypothetical protein
VAGSRWPPPQCRLLTCPRDAGDLQVVFISGRSADDEIGRSISADLHLVALAIFIFMLTAVLGLSK